MFELSKCERIDIRQKMVGHLELVPVPTPSVHPEATTRQAELGGSGRDVVAVLAQRRLARGADQPGGGAALRMSGRRSLPAYALLHAAV